MSNDNYKMLLVLHALLLVIMALGFLGQAADSAEQRVMLRSILYEVRYPTTFTTNQEGAEK